MRTSHRTFTAGIPDTNRLNAPPVPAHGRTSPTPLALLSGRIELRPAMDGPGGWKAEGLCSQTDPDVFYPEKGDSPAVAKRICRQCPVTEECLNEALSNGEKFGVWGGMTKNERRKIADARRRRSAA